MRGRPPPVHGAPPPPPPARPPPTAQVLCAGYFLLGFAALGQLIRIESAAPGRQRRTLQKTFHVMVLVVCYFRATSWGVADTKVEDVRLFNTLWTLPGCLLLSLFSLLVGVLARILKESHSLHVTGYDARNILIANGVFYVLQTALLILNWTPSASALRKFDQWEPDFLGAASLMAAAAFMRYGYLLRRRLRLVVHTAVSKASRKIGAVCAIYTFSFTLRAGVNFFWLDIFDHIHGCEFDGTEVLFYFLVELLPLAAVLVVLGNVPKKASASRQQSTASSASSLPPSSMHLPAGDDYVPLPASDEHRCGESAIPTGTSPAIVGAIHFERGGYTSPPLSTNSSSFDSLTMSDPRMSLTEANLM